MTVQLDWEDPPVRIHLSPGPKSDTTLCTYLTEDCNYFCLTNSIVSLLFRKHFLKEKKESMKCDSTEISKFTGYLGLGS